MKQKMQKSFMSRSKNKIDPFDNEINIMNQLN